VKPLQECAPGLPSEQTALRLERWKDSLPARFRCQTLLRLVGPHTGLRFVDSGRAASREGLETAFSNALKRREVRAPVLILTATRSVFILMKLDRYADPDWRRSIAGCVRSFGRALHSSTQVTHQSCEQVRTPR